MEMETLFSLDKLSLRSERVRSAYVSVVHVSLHHVRHGLKMCMNNLRLYESDSSRSNGRGCNFD